MTIFSIQHARQGLTEVERISDDAAGLAERLHDIDGVTQHLMDTRVRL